MPVSLEWFPKKTTAICQDNNVSHYNSNGLQFQKRCNDKKVKNNLGVSNAWLFMHELNKLIYSNKNSNAV